MMANPRGIKLSTRYPVEIDLKQTDALLPMLFDLAL